MRPGVDFFKDNKDKKVNGSVCKIIDERGFDTGFWIKLRPMGTPEYNAKMLQFVSDLFPDKSIREVTTDELEEVSFKLVSDYVIVDWNLTEEPYTPALGQKYLRDDNYSRLVLFVEEQSKNIANFREYRMQDIKKQSADTSQKLENGQTSIATNPAPILAE